MNSAKRKNTYFQECGQKTDSVHIKKLSKDCEMKMMEIGENETENYEILLKEYLNIFHKNHFQVRSIFH